MPCGPDLLDQIDRDSDKAGILVPAYRVRLQLAHAHENPDSLKNARHWVEGRAPLRSQSILAGDRAAYPDPCADRRTP